MNIEDRLNKLSNIKEVDAPPFMFTGIKQKIENLETVIAPVRWKWSFVAAGMVLMILNVSVFYKQVLTPQKASISTLAKSLDLTNSNELYHEQN